MVGEIETLMGEIERHNGKFEDRDGFKRYLFEVAWQVGEKNGVTKNRGDYIRLVMADHLSGILSDFRENYKQNNFGNIKTPDFEIIPELIRIMYK